MSDDKVDSRMWYYIKIDELQQQVERLTRERQDADREWYGKLQAADAEVERLTREIADADALYTATLEDRTRERDGACAALRIVQETNRVAIETLTRERDEAREECAKAERLWKQATIDRDTALRDLARAMQERIDVALRERDAARDALRKYGRHTQTCDDKRWEYTETKGEFVDLGCTCGLAAVLLKAARTYAAHARAHPEDGGAKADTSLTPRPRPVAFANPVEGLLRDAARVPREPTDDMLDAAAKVWPRPPIPGGITAYLQTVWRAMYDTALQAKP